jgi:hypothetical protein
VAQEFGDHPESAAERMRWVRRLVEVTVAENQVAAAIHTLRYRHRPGTVRIREAGATRRHVA